MIRLAAAPTLGELTAALGGTLDLGLSGARLSRIVSPAELADDANTTVYDGRDGGKRPEQSGPDGRDGPSERADGEATGPTGFSVLVPLFARRHLRAAVASPRVLLVGPELAALVPAGRRWVHTHAPWALAGVLEWATRGEEDRDGAPATSKGVIAPDARIAQGAVVMSGATVGPGCVIEPNAVVYDNVVLGARVRVGACAVIGRPGFGWADGPNGDVRRIPQLGGVIVEDDVDIGPLSTIDAGTLAPTRLRRGVRLDAHVHVGHNVEIGEAVVVAAQSGFAGSVRIERDVQIGGQVGIADHVVVGRGARLAAKAGVIGDVPPGETFAGYPAVERNRWLRAMAKLLRRAPR